MSSVLQPWRHTADRDSWISAASRGISKLSLSIIAADRI
jgi:hypothetical protein